MNIREVEIKTGLTRANIRYYEKEGLLRTVRSENGYRDYTEENVESLLRIRLMRELGISIEEIRRLQAREEELNVVVENRIKQIKKESQKLKDSEMVCQTIWKERVSYYDLDAAYYLKELNGEKRESRRKEITRQDVIPVQVHPFRRYFARATDGMLYDLLFLFIWMVVFRNRNLEKFSFSLLLTVTGLLFTMVFEPLFLTWFSTTPGKWLFGIRIQNKEDGKLTYEEAKARTKSVLLWGCGLSIPGFELYRKIKMYKLYTEKSGLEDLPWEDDSTCTFVDDKGWRYLACAAVWGLLIYLVQVCVIEAFLPRYRGEITPEQFVVNYNEYAKLYESDSYHLVVSETEESRFLWKQTDPNAFVVSLHGNPKPEFRYTEEDGILQSVSFEIDHEVEDLIGGYNSYMSCAVMSFVGAQDSYNPFQWEFGKLEETIMENSYKDFEFTDGDITVQCKIETTGLQLLEGIGFRPENENEPGRLQISFSMERN